MYDVQMRKHLSQAKKLLVNITEYEVLNDITDDITAVNKVGGVAQW